MKWIGQHIYDLVSRFRADVYIDKGLRDKDGELGTSGQILSSTGTQTNWINASSGGVGTLQTVTNNGNTTTNSIAIGSGTNSAPGLSFDSDSNTGVYRASENTVGLSASGIGLTWDGTHLTTSAGGAFYLEKSGSASSPTYAFQSYTTTGMFRPTGLHAIGFSTNGSEKMRLTSTGKLLLNLTSYTGNEDFIINSTTNNGGLLLQRSGVNAIKLSRGGTPSFKIYNSSGSQRINFAENLSYIRDSLMIGGNTAPTEKLEVVGKAIIRKSGSATAHGDTDLFVTDATAASSTAAIQILGGNAGFSNLQFSDTDSYSQGALVYSHTGNYMAFKANASERMRLNSTGLGIGTSSPGFKLTVDETTTNNLTVAHFKHNQGGVISDMLLENSAGADNTGFDINFKLASSGAAAKIGAIRTNSPGAGDTDMFFSTSTNGTTVTEAMRITSNLNVGIGTSSPSYPLHVVGNIKTTDKLLVEDSSNSRLELAPSISNQARISAHKTNLNQTLPLLIQAEGIKFGVVGSGEKMRLTSGGKLLVGGTSEVGTSRLVVDSGSDNLVATFRSAGDSIAEIRIVDSSNYTRLLSVGSQFKIMPNDGDETVVFDGTTTTFNGTVSVGQDDTGHDVIFYGATSGKKMHWDESADALKLAEDVYAYFGDGDDLRIFHQGDSIIASHTNDLKIQNWADGKDIKFYSDNGTGGLTKYLELDGSQTTINVYKTLLIGTTTNTGAYKIDVAGKQRVQDTLELDDVLMLNAISTPADPAAGKSVIYMDSADGGIKCKINVGGTVVTRTLASFE